jgi:hemolysin activation/secretion protein
LSSLGAAKQGDPGVDANPQFSKLTAYAARLQSLGGNWSALLAGTAQTSKDKLPTAEQLGLGGETFLRAFDPSEVIGEKGAAVKLEVRYDLGIAGFASTVYVYGDGGSVKRQQADGGYASTSLSSAGIGVRVSGPRRTRGYLEVAKPGRRDVISEGNRDVRVFAGIGIDF